jgi:hypothetical protein
MLAEPINLRRFFSALTFAGVRRGSTCVAGKSLLPRVAEYPNAFDESCAGQFIGRCGRLLFCCSVRGDGKDRQFVYGQGQ